MEEWKEYKAADFCTNVTDGTHDSPKPKVEGHYLITSKHLQNNVIDFSSAYRISEEDYLKVIQRSRVEQFDILFSMIGTIGNTVRVVSPEVDFAVKNMAIFKMGRNDLKSKWLYYWLKSSTAKAYISSRLAGSTQSYLTLDALRNFPIYAPDERTMQDITDILSSIDDKIELNNRINHNLEEQAQALYKSWFVDFEPFKGGKFVNSELGKIPEGWRVYNLTDIAVIDGGYSYKGSELVPSSTAMATIKNFDRDGSFKIGGYKEIKPGLKVKKEHYISIFDVLVAHTDITQKAEIIGNPALVLSNAGYSALIMSMDLCKVTSQEGFISQGLLYYLLKSDLFKNHALGYVNGTTVLHLSKKALADYKIALPSDLETLHTISTSLMNICKLQAESCEECRKLLTLRDCLLPQMMSGNIVFNR